MTNHSTTRILVDDAYATLVGKAVYIFAYYEWAIICIIECLQPGFVGEYSRNSVMPSGRVLKKFDEVKQNLPILFEEGMKLELRACYEEFEKLIVKRNALIHAHPFRDLDDS